MWAIMSHENKDIFISSFPNVYIFCLIALAKSSSTMLNMSDESRHHHFVPDVKGKAFSFSPLIMTLAVSFCRCSLSKEFLS